MRTIQGRRKVMRRVIDCGAVAAVALGVVEVAMVTVAKGARRSVARLRLCSASLA
jgi:hypothetical protein